MKISLKTLFDSQQLLGKLADVQFTPAKAFHVAKLLQALQKDLAIIEEKRVKLIEQYGEKLEEGMAVKKENMGAFYNTFNEYLAAEIELEIPELHFEDLGDLKLNAKEIMLIEWLIAKQ